MRIAHKLLFAAAVSGLSLAGAAAYADSTPTAGITVLTAPQVTVVRFNDLKLDQPRDIARLFTRVTAAAESVCGPRSLGGYFPTAGYAACYSDAVNRAVAHIDRPSVSAYFQQHGYESAPRKLAFAQQ